MVVDYADRLIAESIRRMIVDTRRQYEEGELPIKMIACEEHRDVVLMSAIRVAAFMRIAWQAKTS